MRMKTRLLLSLCLVLTLSFQAHAQFKVQKGKTANTVAKAAESSDKKLLYSLCGEMSGAAIGKEQDWEQRFYIRIPAKQWKGCKITNVEIGLGFDVGKDSYVFISKDVEKEPVVKQYFQCDTIVPPPYEEDDEREIIGWKNVPLDEAYVIDSDDDLYIGWYTVQVDFWYGPCAIDWDDPASNGNLGSLRRVGKEKWTYVQLEHNPLIRVTVEGDNIPQNHLRTIYYSADELYYKPGETVYVETTIKNEGALPVTSFEVTYQMNQDAPVTKQITDVNLEPMEVYDYVVEAPVNDEGKGNLKVTLSNPNGKPDDFIESTTTLINSFGCLAKGLQKNVIVEEIVSTKEDKCPEATKIIMDAIDKCDRKENVIFIQNHAIAKDEYKIKGYSWFNEIFPISPFIPAVNIDHKSAIPGTLMPADENETTQATSEMFLVDENFGKYLETCLDEEDVYFSLDMDCEPIYDEVIGQNVLQIKIDAKPAIEGLFPDIYQSSMAPLLIEDKVVGQQAGADGEYIHNGIPRAFINDENPDVAYLGDEIKIPRNGQLIEATYPIPDKTWNMDNLKLVCYIVDANMDVRNAVACPVKPIEQGVKKETVENDFAINCKDGTLHIDGNFDKARIFSISGQTLMETNDTNINVSRLEKGIYCILIQKDNRFVSKKFIIQ